MYTIDLDCTDSTSEQQGIYWSTQWLAGVEETRKELARGNGITFLNGKAAIDWLGDQNVT